jgi:predicted enzyme related to lactoylglutathione lyase
MIKEIAFTGTPVTDIARARKFYEGVLGLKPTTDDPEAKWIEYDVAGATFGIGNYGDTWRPVEGGTMIAFECDDVDAMMARVKESGATVMMDLMDSPVCRFGIVADPDGNSVMLHKRNAG